MKKVHLAVALAVGISAFSTAKAQTNTNLYPAVFRAVCVSTNGTNGLVRELVTNTNLIEDCALEHGITNLSSLSLVYNRSNSSLQVVNATNQSLVCTSLTFAAGLSFTTSTTNGTNIVFQRFVFVETNTMASGAISGITTIGGGTNTNYFALRATLLFTEPASGTNSAEICRGTLRVGQAITHGDNDEDDNDDDGGPHGNHGNNGNHGNGNNGNHGQGNNGNGNGNNGNHGK